MTIPRAREEYLPASVLQAKSFRTKSDSRSAFICANPAKCRFSESAVNALIAANFGQNRAV
jgi:hypothetical protein